MISKERYKEFAQAVEKYTNAIDTKESIETKGKVKKIVFSRMMWAESLQWFSFVQFLFILLGLMDDVINNVNSGISDVYAFFGNYNPFQFPVNIASFVAIGLIIFFFCFAASFILFGIPKPGACIPIKALRFQALAPP